MAAEYGEDEDEEEDEHPPNIQIIGLNSEQFITLDIFYLRFIDTVKFLSASLESLVNNLVISCDKPFDKFTHTRDRLKPDAEAEKLIFAKGVLPHEFFDSLDKFEDLQLLAKDCLHSHLTEEGISAAEYERACTCGVEQVWV